MRFLLAGLLILGIPIAAFAQAKGQVLSIGFGNHYRPDCWTPMHVQLTSESSEQAKYQIQIEQEDLDQDRVIYSQHVSLGGNKEGQAATTEEFWVYFQPKPTKGGLPADTFATLNDLNKELKVYLCTEDGKQIAVLPNTATITNIDPRRSQGDQTRSCKLVLMVTDGTDKPIKPYSPDAHLRGIMEDADVEIIQPRDLPFNVIGYQAVDAIIWMDADATYLTQGTRTAAMEALHQYVRQGGNLVICQPPESFKVKPFADLLPVTSTVSGGDWKIDMVDCKDEEGPGQGPFDILRELSRDRGNGELWRTISGTFKVARAIPTSDAKVDDWITWQGATSTYHTPWLARRGVGLGAVTWVAQDLGNPALTEKNRNGWRYIWDRVLGWNNDPTVPENYLPPENADPWQPAGAIDLGYPLIHNTMDLTNTATYLISLACVFFVLYWAVAGPGVYFYLAVRKKSHLSWFYFALSALVATALTILLVRLVLHKPPQLRHVSVIRYSAEDSTSIIQSRFGLYIPQDGPKKIDVLNTASHGLSYIAPFRINPQFVGSDDDSFLAYLQYEIPVRDANDASPLSVVIPYRSTSKKFGVEWTGEIKNRIEVSPNSTIKLVQPGDGGYIDGVLVNHTGYDLADVYLAFQEPQASDADSVRNNDWLLYVPEWLKDGEIHFKDLMIKQNLISDDHPPEGKDPAYGRMNKGAPEWDRYWSRRGDSVASGPASALPLLTLFDRIAPWRMEQDHQSRSEFFRRNARFLDLSAAMNAGELVVMAVATRDGDQTKSPLPFPLMVSDSPVIGEGTTLMQYVFPIDRSQMYRAPGHPAGDDAARQPKIRV